MNGGFTTYPGKPANPPPRIRSPCDKLRVNGCCNSVHSHRHSRESGNPPPGHCLHRIPSFRRRPESRTPVDTGRRVSRVWIPAFAGMTVDGERGAFLLAALLPNIPYS